jgi:photosystem II stability/assembly factor-like uncharacterized protein
VGSITTGETERLSGVSSCGPRNTWAVGAKGVILHWDGARWSKSKNPSDKNLTKVLCRSDKEVWAIGDSGTVLRFDGTAWSLVESGTGAQLVSLVYDGRKLWIGGDRGAVLVRK